MARKKIEAITSLGKDTDKLTVQKSRPLFALWRSGLTLSEFKILDTYLARINSHKPEKRAVVFEKGELERLLGVKKINTPELKERLKHLMGNVVEVPDSTVKKGVRLVTLFEEAVAEQDDNGLWQISLECTQKAMKYFFNIENLGYLRYKLRCITSITSRYTYILFVYLESNRRRKSWEVSLDELKHILNCDKEELYKEYRYFNQKILKRVQKEMHEKTECRYVYEPIKKGRSVVAIRFTLETLPKTSFEEFEEVDPNQITFEDYENHNDYEDDDDEMVVKPQPLQCTEETWEGAVDEFNFSPEQIEELRELIHSLPDCAYPQNLAVPGEVSLDRYHYVRSKVLEINRRNIQKPIRSKFGYLKKLITQDIEKWNPNIV